VLQNFCSALYEEKFLFFTKSFIAYKDFNMKTQTFINDNCSEAKQSETDRQVDVLFVLPPFFRFLDDSFLAYPSGLGTMVSVLKKEGFKAAIYNADHGGSGGIGKILAKVIRRIGLRFHRLARQWARFYLRVHDTNDLIWQETRQALKLTRPKIVGISSSVVTVPVIDYSTGNRSGIIKVIRDVTREKLISRSKSEFISIAAHQLRTPLSAIKWALHMLINGDLGKMEDNQIKLASDAFSTNEKMIRLVNDLLNVARIEDGRFGYDFKKNDFYDMVAQIISVSKPRAKERNINLFFKDNSKGALEFIFDQSKMSLALQNLIDNAIKYTLPGGSITVSLGKKDKYTEVVVSDTGVGVPAHQIGRLFTKFFRAENVMQLQTDGSGLGLFIVHNIVARHGGNIKIQSKEGKGTVFTVLIPMDESMIPSKSDIAAQLYI